MTEIQSNPYAAPTGDDQPGPRFSLVKVLFYMGGGLSGVSLVLIALMPDDLPDPALVELLKVCLYGSWVCFGTSFVILLISLLLDAAHPVGRHGPQATSKDRNP